MVIKHVTLRITEQEYYTILSELGGRSYGKFKGMNIVIFRNLYGSYYVEYVDYIDHIIR